MFGHSGEENVKLTMPSIIIKAICVVMTSPVESGDVEFTLCCVLAILISP